MPDRRNGGQVATGRERIPVGGGESALDALTPLRRARARALLEELERCHYLILTDEAYRDWRDDGWSRGDVDRAVEDLVTAGLAEVEGSHRTLTLWFPGARKGGAK